MSSVVLRLVSSDTDLRGTPRALGALSRQLSASSLPVRHLSEVAASNEEATAGTLATLAVSLASQEAARSLALALAAWSGQHPSSRIMVHLGGSQLEISGSTPESADTLLQRLVPAAPPAPAAAAVPPVLSAAAAAAPAPAPAPAAAAVPPVLPAAAAAAPTPVPAPAAPATPPVLPAAAAAPAATPPPPTAPPLQFRLKQVPDGPETLVSGSVIAGRTPGSGLRLPSPATQQGGASRRHAELSIADGALWVEDLSSTNGTFVNGIKVQQKTRLAIGDRVRFDRIEFEVLGPPDPTRVRPAPLPAAPALRREEPAPQVSQAPPPDPPVPPAPPPPPAPVLQTAPPSPPAAAVAPAPAAAAPDVAAPAPAAEPPPAPPRDAPVVDAVLADPPPDEFPVVAVPARGAPEPRGDTRALYIPPDLLRDRTAFIVEGGAGQRGSRPRPVLMPGRQAEIRILDDSDLVIDLSQPLQPRRRYSLEVSIKVRRELGRAPPPAEVNGEPVWVWVVLTDETDGDPAVEGRLFELDHRYGALKLPLSGDSQEVASFQFAARPPASVQLERREICPRIGVRIYHKLNLIDHTQIDLSFGQGAAYPTARVKSMQVEGRPIEQPEPGSAPRALSISISRPDPQAGHYRFALVAGNRNHPEQPGLFASRKLAQEELDGFAAEFRDILLKSVLGRSLTDVNFSITEQETLLARLSALGDGIVARLFSPGAQDDILEPGEQLPQGSIIQICLGEGAQDLVVPWQILTVKPATNRDSPGDPHNLWGYRFAIEIKRSGDGVDQRPPAARTVPTARVTYARWGFENEAGHHARLKTIVAESRFPAALVDPVVEARGPLLDVLRAGGGELLYVYAPGHAAPPATPPGSRERAAVQARISDMGRQLDGTIGLMRNDVENLRRVQKQFEQAAGADSGSSLSLKRSDVTLADLASRMDRRSARLNDAPIVFLNTCESAQVWNGLTGSFAGFFLEHGARAVLGTESTIPMVTADVFGMAALEQLFRGETLGKAVLAARWKLLNDHRNPLGLCYCIYAGADARIINRGEAPGAEEDLPTPALTFTTGPIAGGRYVLRVGPGQPTEWSLGADPAQDIVVTGEGVSRQHASIIQEEHGKRFRIVDRFSRNGTFVNNRKIESRILTQGAEVRLGTVTFVFELLDRAGHRWGAPVPVKPERSSQPIIDGVLLLVASLVAGSVLFFVLTLLHR